MVYMRALPTALLALAPMVATAQAGNCDAIRARIDAKVRASGVTDFKLIVAAKEAQLEGKVVGNCDLGRRKIVYVSPAASAPGGDEAILTECKDGTVTMGGDCKP